MGLFVNMKLVFENKAKRGEEIVATIGVCVKDSEAMIKGVFKSIQGQDFPHQFMEVVVVDDGSKDKTLSSVIRSASESNVSVRVFSGDWIGLGRARNFIVKQSRGIYILWVDGDMILDKSFVRKQVGFMRNSSDVGVAKATSCISSNQNILGFLEDSSYFAFCFRNKGPNAKIVGTGGSICRSDVIRAVGGFDDLLIGVGEDIDLEYRIKQAGWSLYMQSPGVYFEKRRTTWSSLWREYFWHGLGGSRLYRKNRDILSLYKLTPLAGFLAGVVYSIIAYKHVHRKTVFLLPIQFAFKRIAWCMGFIKGQIMGASKLLRK
jgi:glycosyltransferase involved in cell wall biosynthesis